MSSSIERPPSPSLPAFECRSVLAFEKLQCVGKGTYGTVYKARDRDSGEIVALKKLRMSRESEGFPITSIREIKLLRRLKHVNIVRLLDVVVGTKPDSIFLVFEYCDHDFASLMDNMKIKFSESEVKCILLQILRAVSFLHANFVLHRDLKLSNMLMTNSGVLKIADFGLARHYGHPLQSFTPKVVTLWYRAPEILLGSEKYHAASDCWSVGCMMGELLNHRPLLPGNTEMEQLQLIFKLLGAPNEKIWPGYALLGRDNSLIGQSQYLYNNLCAEFPNLSEHGTNLLKGLLCYDPAKRITAQQALNHPFFNEAPFPKQPDMMPKFPSLTHTALNSQNLTASASVNAAPILPVKRRIEEDKRNYKK